MAADHLLARASVIDGGVAMSAIGVNAFDNKEYARLLQDIRQHVEDAIKVSSRWNIQTLQFRLTLVGRLPDSPEQCMIEVDIRSLS